MGSQLARKYTCTPKCQTHPTYDDGELLNPAAIPTQPSKCANMGDMEIKK
jgi:hypothetical protein